MSPDLRGPAVIDTGVFGTRLTLSGRLLASRCRPLLAGRATVISFVTVAELEGGPWRRGMPGDTQGRGLLVVQMLAGDLFIGDIEIDSPARTVAFEMGCQ